MYQVKNTFQTSSWFSHVLKDKWFNNWLPNNWDTLRNCGDKTTRKQKTNKKQTFLFSLYFKRSMQTKSWATFEGLRGHTGSEPTQARPVPLWNICPVGDRAAWPALQIGPLWQKCPCGTVTSSLESGGEPHFLIVTQSTQTYQSSLSQNLHCVLKHLKFYPKSFT